jgi:DNA-binding response OmpR family regulator
MPRILVVDDDEAMRGIIRDNLSISYEIVDTGVPGDALALTLQHRPDAILLDLSMPGLSGFELCRALSSLSFTQQIPIFIVSGEDERNKAFCENLGATGYFTKPIDFSRLKMCLAEVVRSKEVERRADVRVQLKLNLILKGKDRTGGYFEVRAVTENVSKGGFLCACVTPLKEATTVEVCLSGERNLNLGFARLVRIVESDNSAPRYGFQFIGTGGAKLLE